MPRRERLQITCKHGAPQKRVSRRRRARPREPIPRRRHRLRLILPHREPQSRGTRRTSLLSGHARRRRVAPKSRTTQRLARRPTCPRTCCRSLTGIDYSGVFWLPLPRGSTGPLFCAERTQAIFSPAHDATNACVCSPPSLRPTWLARFLRASVLRPLRRKARVLAIRRGRSGKRSGPEPSHALAGISNRQRDDRAPSAYRRRARERPCIGSKWTIDEPRIA
jgi:hypothetical protein